MTNSRALRPRLPAAGLFAPVTPVNNPAPESVVTARGRRVPTAGSATWPIDGVDTMLSGRPRPVPAVPDTRRRCGFPRIGLVAASRGVPPPPPTTPPPGSSFTTSDASTDNDRPPPADELSVPKRCSSSSRDDDTRMRGPVDCAASGSPSTRPTPPSDATLRLYSDTIDGPRSDTKLKRPMGMVTDDVRLCCVTFTPPGLLFFRSARGSPPAGSRDGGAGSAVTAPSIALCISRCNTLASARWRPRRVGDSPPLGMFTTLSTNDSTSCRYASSTPRRRTGSTSTASGPAAAVDNNPAGLPLPPPGAFASYMTCSGALASTPSP